MYDTNLNSESKVKEIVCDQAWKWPIANTWEVRDLIDNTPDTLQPGHGPDRVIWTPDKHGSFSINSTWNI